MPMKSEAQRRYLWANEPEVAAEFEAETKPGSQLPNRLHPPRKDSKRRRMSAIRRAAGKSSLNPEDGVRYAETA